MCLAKAMDSAAAQRWMPHRRLIMIFILEAVFSPFADSLLLARAETASGEYSLIRPESSSAPKPMERPERYTCSATEVRGVGKLRRRAIDVTMPCKLMTQRRSHGKGFGNTYKPKENTIYIQHLSK